MCVYNIGCHGNDPSRMQSKEKIVKMSVSSTCSHVAVASNTNENEIKLSVYILPIDSWQSELPHTAERWSQTSVPSGKKGAAPHTDVCSREDS